MQMSDTQPFRRILEVKQALDARVETGAGRADPDGTLHMLAQMRGVLSRELDRFAGAGDGEIDGKAAVDLVSLIARTLEKIDQLERQMAEARGAASGEPSEEERASLRRTVHAMIDALAERKVAKMRMEEAGEEVEVQREAPLERVSRATDVALPDPGVGPG